MAHFSPKTVEECRLLTKLPVRNLKRFADALCLTEAEYLGFDDEYSMTYEYIISDDAEITALSLRLLSDDIKFSAFELDKKEIHELTTLIEKLDVEWYKISRLDEAFDLWMLLYDIDSDLGLDLVNASGDEAIVDALRKVYSEVAALSVEINGYITIRQWKAKKARKKPSSSA